MNRSSSRGFKLTTVIFAVLVLAISALFSNGSVANDEVFTVDTNLTEQLSSTLVIAQANS